MELFRLGIAEALGAIAAGRCSASEWLDACIARTVAVEPLIHAFAHFDADAVRAVVRQTREGPLAGVPIGIKDIIRTARMPTEMGSAAFSGHVPDHSASVIDALHAAGAIVFGKTVTTEFAWRHPGATRNPWNLGHTPGGSSSGSAAAVAAGCVPGALGTQTLGSVLRPAAFCGVVGFKPSYGAIPRTGVYPLADSLDHIGVFTRSVADAALLAAASMAGSSRAPSSMAPSSRAPTSMAPSSMAAASMGRDGVDVPHVTALSPIGGLHMPDAAPRFALLGTSQWSRVATEQQELVDEVARVLAADGASVTAIELPAAFDAIWSTAQTLCDVEGALVNAELAAERPPRISQHTIDLVTRGAAVSALDYLRARRTQRELVEAFAMWMEPFDAVLTTPALGTAPPGLDDTGDAVFCTPASLLGAPAITLPAGSGATGLPLGIQLIDRWGRDRRLLETALWVERALGRAFVFPMP